MEHPLITNLSSIRENTVALMTLAERHQEFCIKVTTQLLADRPTLFPNLAFYMTAPVCIIKDTVVTAKTRVLQAKYTLEVAGAEPASNFQEEMVRIISTEIGAELLAEQTKLRAQGFEMCPYIVVMSSMIVDADTFMPAVVFKTRYGVYDPNAKKVEETA